MKIVTHYPKGGFVMYLIMAFLIACSPMKTTQSNYEGVKANNLPFIPAKTLTKEPAKKDTPAANTEKIKKDTVVSIVPVASAAVKGLAETVRNNTKKVDSTAAKVDRFLELSNVVKAQSIVIQDGNTAIKNLTAELVEQRKHNEIADRRYNEEHEKRVEAEQRHKAKANVDSSLNIIVKYVPFIGGLLAISYGFIYLLGYADGQKSVWKKLFRA